MKKISAFLTACLFVLGSIQNPLDIIAQEDSVNGVVTQDVPIYSICYAGYTTTTYYGTVYTRGVIVKEGALFTVGYDSVFGEFTNEMMVYRYRDSYGTFYEPLKDGSVNELSIYSVYEYKRCETYNVHAD